MDRKEIFSTRTVTVEEAVQVIRNGDRVVFSQGAGIPQVVPEELLKRREEYADVEIFHMLRPGTVGYVSAGMERHFRHCAAVVCAGTREAVAANRADYMPCFFFEVPHFFRSGLLPVDVAVVQVSPPDAEGFCSFGPACDYVPAACEAARVVIAEMNDQMPRIGRTNTIHISELDYVVPCSRALPEAPPPAIGAVEEAIGQFCAQLVEDGSTLQLGIGAIPDAVLHSLTEKNDLGLHTELLADGVIDLIERGVINGRRKTLHRGEHVATFLLGTSRLYEFAAACPEVALYPVDHVNHPFVIMKNERMVSINSCLEVDLMGQVNSETIGLRQFSGAGGQVDYVRGASLSPGGKSIMAMPSTAVHGTVSRIVPFLSQGAAVTTSRNDVDYVVTEYGIAHLKAKTLRERARSLIAIAHPSFREGLMEEFVRRFR